MVVLYSKEKTTGTKHVAQWWNQSPSYSLAPTCRAKMVLQSCSHPPNGPGKENAQPFSVVVMGLVGCRNLAVVFPQLRDMKPG